MAKHNKILSQSGISLADLYNVQGSVAGVDNLDSEDVKVVHEMGATIQSERLSGTVITLQTIALAQNLTWDLTVSVGPEIHRILNVEVVHNTVLGRVEDCMVAISTNIAGNITEIPVWNWDDGVGNDQSKICRIGILGAAVADLLHLVPGRMTGPSMAIGTNQPGGTPLIAFRGNTNGFGAGTVTVTALILVARASSVATGLSNFGLPLPGW